MTTTPRTVQNNILRSEELPNIEIQIDPEFHYVGNTSFILYEVAHVEQHHFIVADAENRVTKRLWFQFEGYLADNNHTYDYSGMESLNIDGFTFIHNNYPMNVDDAVQERPTSDTAHAVAFLKEKGYVLRGDILSHRMVWLDADLRNELMIIYSEKLDPSGTRAAELIERGPDTPEWIALSKALLERSLASFKIIS
jgi:hypothetical protein